MRDTANRDLVSLTADKEDQSRKMMSIHDELLPRTLGRRVHI